MCRSGVDINNKAPWWQIRFQPRENSSSESKPRGQDLGDNWWMVINAAEVVETPGSDFLLTHCIDDVIAMMWSHLIPLIRSTESILLTVHDHMYQQGNVSLIYEEKWQDAQGTTWSTYERCPQVFTRLSMPKEIMSYIKIQCTFNAKMYGYNQPIKNEKQSPRFSIIRSVRALTEIIYISIVGEIHKYNDVTSTIL